MTIKSKLNLHSFIVIGIITLSLVVTAGIGFSLINDNVITGVFSSGTIHNKKLPIYCVDQKEQKIALTFDAAWGGYSLMEPCHLKSIDF